jgi:HTH-type transcriptional regulator / antitoxin HigA
MQKRCDMEIRPIKTKKDHQRAVKEIERLWGSPPGSEDGDKLEILVTLVSAYDDEHYPIDPPDPVDAIQFRMEQMGLKRADLEPLLGSRARVAEILNRRRPLSISMIRSLHQHLGIPAEVLIR